MWAFSSSPTHQFSVTHKGWCVGICHLAHTPVSSPTPKLLVAMCFCSAHGNCPSVLYKQVATLFFYPSCHVFLQGTRQLPSVHVSRWQLSFTELPCVFAWYMATAPTCTYMATALTCTLADGNSSFLHGNCPSMLVSTWQLSQLPSVSMWQLLKF